MEPLRASSSAADGKLITAYFELCMFGYCPEVLIYHRALNTFLFIEFGNDQHGSRWQHRGPGNHCYAKWLSLRYRSCLVLRTMVGQGLRFCPLLLSKLTYPHSRVLGQLVGCSEAEALRDPRRASKRRGRGLDASLTGWSAVIANQKVNTIGYGSSMSFNIVRGPHSYLSDGEINWAISNVQEKTLLCIEEQFIEETPTF